ncbi:MAG: C40 family peptidase [Bacilli bacterium]|nr:C40 family peptidase [Bacilli bacterium]
MLKYKKSFFRLSLTTMLFFIMFFSLYVYRNYMIYDNLDASLTQKEVKYGNLVSLGSLIDTVDGEYKIVTDLDTKKLGNQDVSIEVKKNNITKVIPFTVRVYDNTKPKVKIKKSNITVMSGSDYNLKKNVKSVIDDEEELAYKKNAKEGSKEYFTIDSNFNKNVPGTYKVKVKAVDRANNVTVETFTINVKEEPQEEVITNNNTTINNGEINNSAPANVNGNSMVSLAYSLIGSRYVSGGSSPAGFDCSGFVAYVYSRFGKNITHSAAAQAYLGVGVSYANAKPGDILSWGHGGRVTHSALYVGNGIMIHATNPSQGVIASNVAAWERGSYDSLMYVRRVN